MRKTTKTAKTSGDLTTRQLNEMYRQMLLIRRFEEVAFKKALAGLRIYGRVQNPLVKEMN